MKKNAITKNTILLVAFLVTFLGYFFSAAVFAAGYFDKDGYASTITLPSTLTIPSDAAVGDVIYTSDAISANMRDGSTTTSYFFPTYTTNSFTLSSSANYVYETGIAGLGFRLRGSFNTPSESDIQQYWGEAGATHYWKGSTTTYYQQSAYLEFVITSSEFKSGTVDLSSVVAELRFNKDNSQDMRVVYWQITFSGTTSVAVTSCEASYDSIVKLGTAYTSQFDSVGATANSTDFNITLTCNSTSTIPSITFKGTADDNESTVFKNTNGSSKGVGVQLLYSGSVITPNTEFTLAQITSTSATDYTFNAQLYRTSSIITAGNINTVVTFSLSYE